MSKIPGKNTKPELLVRKFLFRQGFRYRLHVKNMPGKPDIVLRKYKTIILVQGCFWHGHENCKDFVIPKSNRDYWIPKIEKNLARDIQQQQELKATGWNVIVLWECQIKDSSKNLLDLLVQGLLSLPLS